MKKNIFLNGMIKSGNELIGPFAVELNFDEGLPGYKQKKGILYTLVDNKTISRFKTLMRTGTSNKEAVFEAKYEGSIIELRGFSPTTLSLLSEEERNNIKKLCEFTFRTFVRRNEEITKNLIPSEVLFHIEDMVFFRPALKGNSNFLNPDEEPKTISVNLKEFENCLQFETDAFLFKTTCTTQAPVTIHNRYQVSVSTKPLLVVKSKVPGLTENDMVGSGQKLLLLLSFLEERFINYISVLIRYQLEEKDRYAYEFRHTHYSNPMEKPRRYDLEAGKPMDKLFCADIKTMYLSYEHLTNDLKINFAQVIYLYLNAKRADMIYYPVINFYSCMEKILKIGPKAIKDFSYSKSRKQKTHEAKVRQLCSKIKIDNADLLNKNGEFGYIQIRHDYIHNVNGKRYTPEEIWNAEDMAGYLARRLIFSLLGLDYKRYASCGPQKYGRIGL